MHADWLVGGMLLRAEYNRTGGGVNICKLPWWRPTFLFLLKLSVSTVAN